MTPLRGTDDLSPEQRPRRMTRRSQLYRRKGLRPKGPTLTAMLRGRPFSLPNPMDQEREFRKRFR